MDKFNTLIFMIFAFLSFSYGAYSVEGEQAFTVGDIKTQQEYMGDQELTINRGFGENLERIIIIDCKNPVEKLSAAHVIFLKTFINSENKDKINIQMNDNYERNAIYDEIIKMIDSNIHFSFYVNRSGQRSLYQQR